MPTDWLRTVLDRIADLFPPDVWLHYSFNVRALVGVVLVGLICGAVGSLVVGNRMAFFSDALAHCAFAGVILGILLSLGTNHGDWLVPVVMVGFGVLVGFAIAFVREHSTLSSDTVIGVFFAFATGFGVMFLGVLGKSSFKNPETFLFGSPLSIFEGDILLLFVLLVLLSIILVLGYNSIVFGSFNASLARSRRLKVRVWNYVFIVLLAFIVNICIKAVGALLINALLVVPAATAANLGRNVRQMFRWSIIIAIAAGILGLYVSNRMTIRLPDGDDLHLVPSGAMIVVCITAFFGSLAVRMYRDRRPREMSESAPPSPALSP